MDIPHGLKLRHLECFLAVAEEGTISAAARRRNITQPALSKTIADLETLLGARLFERVGRRTVPTPAGDSFRRHALSALHSLETGVRTISGGRPVDVVSVGVLPTVAGGLFPSIALEFSQLRPEARVSVTTGPHNYLIGRLREGEIDLMVGRMPTARDMPGLRFEYLYQDRIELVARAGHPGAGLDAARALRRYPLILPNRGALIRETVDEYLNVIGLPDAQPAFESVSLAFALPLLLASDMLWFISRGVIARDLAADSLMAFELASDFMSGAVGMTSSASAVQNDHVELLATLLRARAGPD
ncbi:LysR family transcriptional regulator [Halovulum dunhuangense]|uniref:LysR family transcriptional regulator n=1 Tax=Halovulum dunhuangense TaxID=1505036 RepID=A0A849L1I3_9RHOB|nr:LysR substrate-binding domain-containing protein [Halovulum dunhuangense]NNU80146.1 LysR family transcriptional regulator [Halovulum dunhuangense]